MGHVDRAMLCRVRTHELVAALLEALDDLADEAALDAVRLDLLTRGAAAASDQPWNTIYIPSHARETAAAGDALRPTTESNHALPSVGDAFRDREPKAAQRNSRHALPCRRSKSAP